MAGSPSRVLALWTRALLDELRPAWREAAASAFELLDPEALLGSGALIPHEDMVEVWKSLTSDGVAATFGAEFGARNAERSIGLLAYASAHAEDLGGALDALVRLQRLADTRNEVSLERDGRFAILRHVPPSSIGPWPAHLAESVVGAAVHLGRAFTKGELVIRRVAFQHDRRDVDNVAAWFRCPVDLEGPANDIVMDRSALSIRLGAADRAMFASLLSAAVRSIDQLPDDTDLIERTRRELRLRLEARPTIDEVAASLHVSGRTLQRRLETAGLTFRRLRDSVRLEALAEIGESNKRLVTAGRIGFSDPSSLRRLRRRSSR